MERRAKDWWKYGVIIILMSVLRSANAQFKDVDTDDGVLRGFYVKPASTMEPVVQVELNHFPMQTPFTVSRCALRHCQAVFLYRIQSKMGVYKGCERFGQSVYATAAESAARSE